MIGIKELRNWHKELGNFADLCNCGRKTQWCEHCTAPTCLKQMEEHIKFLERNDLDADNEG